MLADNLMSCMIAERKILSSEFFPFFLPYFLARDARAGRQPNCGIPIAECGLKRKTQKIRNPQSEIRNNWAD